MLPGRATQAATQQFLEKRFDLWKYQSSWKQPLAPLEAWSSRLGIEFETADIPHIRPHLEQLLKMGCNHFQWNLRDPEELVHVPVEPLWGLFQGASPHPLTNREGVILSLRLPSVPSDSLDDLLFQTRKRMQIAHWDRLLLASDSTAVGKLEPVFDWIQQNSQQATQIGLHFSGSTPDQTFFSELQSKNIIDHLHVPCNLVQFRDWVSPASPLEFWTAWPGSISCYSPFAMQSTSYSSSLIADDVNFSQDYSQMVQTTLALLKASETRLNADLQEWRQSYLEGFPLEEFNFVEYLEEACETIRHVDDWESYMSALWYPPFRQHIQNWSPKIPAVFQEGWRWQIKSFMEHIHTLLGVQAESLRQQQAERLSPFREILDTSFPETPMILTFAAKTLLLWSSVPWSETILFPWHALDNAIEYLGLMRLQLLKPNQINVILQKLLEAEPPSLY